jgi:hypothetical protein
MGKTDFNATSQMQQQRQDASGKYMPAYQGAVQNAQASAQAGGAQQLQNNRLNTSNPFASQTFNADGSVSQQFNGGLGQAASGLMGQAGGLSQPMDWGQFGQAGTGDQARDQAIQGAYGQATSRLDPQWDRRMEATRTQLLNQGLDPSSEAFKNAMQDQNFARNDAYSSAMNGAIAQGTAAGDSAFRNNMSARQQAITEALKARGMPLEELGQLQGLAGQQPTYNQDNSSLASALASGSLGTQGAQTLFNMNHQNWNDLFSETTGQQQQDAATAQGAGSAATGLLGLAMMFSDERLKRDIVRHGFEVLPGVPLATWRWASGAPGVGVIAQDLEKVRPDLVATHPSGFLMVNYEGLKWT